MHAFSIFVFAPVQRNRACFTWKSAQEIRSLLQWQVCHAKQNKTKQKKKKKKKRKKKGKADLTAVLHIRELPHLHVK